MYHENINSKKLPVGNKLPIKGKNYPVAGVKIMGNILRGIFLRLQIIIGNLLPPFGKIREGVNG